LGVSHGRGAGVQRGEREKKEGQLNRKKPSRREDKQGMTAGKWTSKCATAQGGGGTEQHNPKTKPRVTKKKAVLGKTGVEKRGITVQEPGRQRARGHPQTKRPFKENHLAGAVKREKTTRTASDPSP